MTQLFDFDDILIEPSILSEIRSRKEINTRYVNGMLPLMTAPMDTVVGQENHELFLKNGITPVLPRTKNSNLNLLNNEFFLSFSMVDFENHFLIKTPIQLKNNKKVKVLIDVANGHMEELLNLSIKSKKKYGDNLLLMVGNVANPETFLEYSKVGVDYVRIGIGNGNGCLTTVQTGVGYPMASLISECNKIKKLNRFKGDTKIVADGGFKKYSDIIKALALGADYVMLGSVLNKCLESSGKTTRIIDGGNHLEVNQYDDYTKEMFNVEIPLYKHFRGMSTKEVQKSWGKEVLTTSEGVVRTQKVEYTIEGWVNNIESYLKSAMSYSNKKEINEFVGGVKYNFITMNSFNRFNK
jgi:IMP dehydrogenase/GMP reductase